MIKISQQEVLDCLEKEKRPMSVKQIAEIIGRRDKKIYPLINKLLKWNEVFYKEITAEQAIRHFNCKRRMFIYSFKQEWLDNLILD